MPPVDDSPHSRQRVVFPPSVTAGGNACESSFWNRPVVPEVGIDMAKQVFRQSAFPQAGPLPWLDRPDAHSQIDARQREGSVTGDEAALCRAWVDEGYLIIERFFDDEELDRTWRAYEAAIADERVKPPVEPLFDGDKLPGRTLNPHFQVDALKVMLLEPRMTRLISLLLGARALPFQTIAGHKSSQQLQHSDFIHMTTYPVGYLAATWVAFEDIHPESGPLVYHPKSHRLPYLLAEELGIPFDQGYQAYQRVYEPAVQELIRRRELETKVFLPRKGDVLLWHANLLHGGTRLQNPAHASRKALVCHYFAEGVVCYHDLVGMPSWVVPFEFNNEAYLQANPDVQRAGVDPFRHYIHFGRFEGRRLRP